MRTLWRNASIATCDGTGRVHDRGALVTDDGRIAWVGDERDLPAGVFHAPPKKPLATPRKKH